MRALKRHFYLCRYNPNCCGLAIFFGNNSVNINAQFVLKQRHYWRLLRKTGRKIMARPIDEQVPAKISDGMALAAGGSPENSTLQSKLFYDSYVQMPTGFGGNLVEQFREQENQMFPDEVRDKNFYLRDNAENAGKYLNRLLKESGDALSRSDINEVLKNKNMTYDERRAYTYLRDNFDLLSTGWIGASYDPFSMVITSESFRKGASKHIHER